METNLMDTQTSGDSSSLPSSHHSSQGSAFSQEQSLLRTEDESSVSNLVLSYDRYLEAAQRQQIENATPSANQATADRSSTAAV